MKPMLISLLFSFWLSAAFSQNRCGVTGADRVDNPAWELAHAQREQILQKWIAENSERIGTRSTVTIPVVVHVLWNSGEQNISDEQIASQLAILNQDFRSLNVETPTIPAVFQPLIADVELEFCLARIDPNGNPTSGITRKFTNNPVGIGGTTAIHYSNQGGQGAWDTARYLNIWVAKFAGGIGGIASFPGEGPAAEDGIEINYLQFGNINVNPPYHLGRTLTHEVGHYLNLEHPWGPSITDCCGDDFVGDTPETCETYIGECPAHPAISCSMPDVFMNYMFYTNDDCMGMFTNGQKIRMLATLNTLRSGLLNSSVCEAVSTNEVARTPLFTVVRNPVSDQLFLTVAGENFQSGKISILSPQGTVQLEQTLMVPGELTLAVGALNRGIYFIVLESGKSRQVEKVVLQ